MINLNDPLERLRAANPFLLTDVAVPPPDPVLFGRITSGPGLRRRRRARRFVPAVAALGVLAGAVGFGLLRGDVSVPDSVACYERADLRSNTAVAIDDGRGAVAACADLWRQGMFAAATEAPPLVECVLRSGVAGVFPAASGRDVCRDLDLPPVEATVPPPTSSSTVAGQPPANPAARVLAFRDVVGPLFLDSPCVEPAAAGALVRRELDRAGLADWTIRGGEGLGDGFSAQRPCATLSLRPENREVVLVPSPRR